MKRANCPHRYEEADMLFHPGGTAFRVEPMPTAPRCVLKPPSHWSEAAKERSVRWILSGGSCLVFGHCDAQCPAKEQQT